MPSQYNWEENIRVDLVTFFSRKLTREVTNLFDWTGLDKFIPSRLFEYNLVTKGKMMIFDENTYEYLILPCSTVGHDIYGQSTKAVGYSFNDQGSKKQYERIVARTYLPHEVSNDKCVVVENMLHYNEVPQLIKFYALRLAAIWQTIDINILWQNIPPIISTDGSDEQLTIKKLLADIWSGKPYILKDNALSLKNGIGVDIGLADIELKFDMLHKAKEQVLSDFRQDIGISTAGTNKESGVLESEITANSQSIETCLSVMKSQRELFCKTVREVYGLDISFEIVGKGEDNGASNNRAEEVDDDLEF